MRLPAATRRWSLRDARVPACLLSDPIQADREGLAQVDLVIDGLRIVAVSPAGASEPDPAEPALVAPGLVLPCFTDAHTHLDKGHIWPRAANPDGTFAGARETVAADRAARWTAVDVAARMEFGLRCAYAHGTRAIRTHIDSVGPQTRISWPVVAEARDRWAGRIDLQASPLFGTDLARDPTHMADIAAMVERFGRCLGAVTYPIPGLRDDLEALFRLASDRGWALDFHADETGDPAINTLELIADTALRFRFPHPILVGHCCTLAIMDEENRRRTIGRVAEAGLAIVSLPMCNMYLQDRLDPGHTPRWRGVTAIKELAAAGVPVCIASDNTRDPFYAYGDLDMVEVWREGTRIAHLDHPFGRWAETVTTVAARAIGAGGSEPPIRAGAPADLVLLHARSLSELMARPSTPRTVVRDGRPIEAEPPPYSDLDALEGLRP